MKRTLITLSCILISHLIVGSQDQQSTNHQREIQGQMTLHIPFDPARSFLSPDMTPEQQRALLVQGAALCAEAHIHLSKAAARLTNVFAMLLYEPQEPQPHRGHQSSRHSSKSSKKVPRTLRPSHGLPNGTPVAARPLGSGDHQPSFRRSSTQQNGQHSVTPPGQFRKTQPARPLPELQHTVYYTHG